MLGTVAVQRCACGGACGACRRGANAGTEGLTLRRADSGAGIGQPVAPPAVHDVLSSPGHPLDPAARAFMERRFGHDFGRVRIHDDALAARSARSVGALAYTVGERVVFGSGAYAPGTSQGDHLLAHELAHVVQQRSLGAPAMVYRQVDPGGGGGAVSPGRVVYLDNDVLGEIAGGNTQVAQALEAMRAAGAQIRMTRYNYVEATHGEPVGAGARMLIVRQLGFTIDEGGGLASRRATYEELSTGKPVMVQPKDVPMIAAVRAAGPGAELWSLDGGVKENARRFGIRIAPESGPRGGGPKKIEVSNVRAGLANVGLGDWDIAPDGTPVRRPVVASVGTPLGKGHSVRTGRPAAESDPPAPTGPPARTASGQIGGGARPGGGAPPGGTPPPAPEGWPQEPAEATRQPAGPREVTAEKGAPLEPVAEATPGFRPERGAGIGGAIQILQSILFANLQQAEVDKFQQRLATLQPQIDAYLAGGYSVELLLIVEKPNRPDLLCLAHVYCDQSQFVYFHDLYINYVGSVEPIVRSSPRDTSHTTMGPRGGRVGFVPYPYQGGPVVDERVIPFLRTRDPDHHCEFEKTTLYPPKYASPLSPLAPVVPPSRPAPTERPTPRLDFAAKRALAAAPARVYVFSENIGQSRTAAEVVKELSGNPLFGAVKEEMGGGLGRTRTVVSYSSELDKPKAEALAALIRAAGVSSVRLEIEGSGDGDPGVLGVSFGRDAEK